MDGLRGVLERLELAGYPSRAISVGHLDEIRSDLDSLYENGLIDEHFFQDRLKHFVYEVPKELPNAKSIIVIAVPQPIVNVTFRWNGKKIPAIVPPTYADGNGVNQQVKNLLTRTLGPGPFEFRQAALPLKTLATRSGLAFYGRNNITYIEKFGSFHRLMAFYSDCPFEVDHWQERELLSTCLRCKACIKACPVEAITEERILIRAERCLSYLNEMTADRPFPDWVKPESHNAIVGCMHCQRVCPHNNGVLRRSETRDEFTEQETEFLLRGDFTGERASQMERRLERIGMDLTIFPRNLAVLLEQSSSFDRPQRRIR